MIDLYFFLECTVIMLLLAIMAYSLFQKVYISYLIVFVPLFMLYCASCFKYAALGIPMYFTDLAYTFKIFGVADSGNMAITPAMVVMLVAGLLLAFLLRKIDPKPLKLSARRVCFVLSLVLTVVLSAEFFAEPMLAGKPSAIDEDDLAALDNQIEEFVSGIESEDTGSKDNLELLSDGNEDTYEENYIEDNTKAEVKPNVVVILSESFWDITSMEKVQLSNDPIPNFKRLKNEGVSGNLIAPTFGGGTAHVEFEVQTGFINRFTGTTSAAYETVIDKPITSLATIFKEQGYSAVGIHSFKKDFYNRVGAYPHLGYDSFIALEDIENPKYCGTYVSDEVITDMIIDNLEDTEEPSFIFAVTMENHQAYNKDKYGYSPIKVLNEDMTQDMTDSVEAYVTGLNHADAELNRLVEYLRESGEPTTILFFGDHQPSLGPYFALYNYVGEVLDIENKTKEEYHKLMSVPFLIWSNYETESKNEHVSAIGSNFIGNYLLNYLDMEKPLFYHFLDAAYNSFKFASREELFIDGDGVLYGATPEEYLELLEMYELYQNKELYYGIQGEPDEGLAQFY